MTFTLLDDLVGQRNERGRELDPDPIGCLEIDYQLEPGRALDGKIRRLGPSEDASDIVGEPLEALGQARPIGKKPADVRAAARLRVESPRSV